MLNNRFFFLVGWIYLVNIIEYYYKFCVRIKMFLNKLECVFLWYVYYFEGVVVIVVESCV